MIHRVSRWTHAEEKLKSVWQIIAVIALQFVRHIVKRELPADANIDSFAVRKVANVTDRVTGDRKDCVVIDFIEHEFVS